MRCFICDSDKAMIRQYEIQCAYHTGRAHVDCEGHSQYRPVNRSEISESERYYDLIKNQSSQTSDRESFHTSVGHLQTPPPT